MGGGALSIGAPHSTVHSSCRTSGLLSASPAHRREIDQNGNDKTDNRPHRPLPAPPVVHRRVPADGSGQNEKAEDRPDGVIKDSAEPACEYPENEDRYARRGESDDSGEARHFGL